MSSANATSASSHVVFVRFTAEELALLDAKIAAAEKEAGVPVSRPAAVKSLVLAAIGGKRTMFRAAR